MIVQGHGSKLLSSEFTIEIMDYKDVLKNYEKALGEQTWDAVATYIYNDAVFIFTEGTYSGKQEIEKAFKRTFDLIEDEVYRVSNVNWIVEKDDIAVCIFDFHWSGKIDGEEASGGGRGTNIIQKEGDQWYIIHEHLGPFAR